MRVFIRVFRDFCRLYQFRRILRILNCAVPAVDVGITAPSSSRPESFHGDNDRNFGFLSAFRSFFGKFKLQFQSFRPLEV